MCACVWALSRWCSFTWRSPPCVARWTSNGPDGGSRLLHWDGSHQFDASGNKVKCRGQFVGGRVLSAEVQKANEGHQAWEASQVHTFLHSDWCGTRSLAHSLTHSLTQVDGKEDGRSGCKVEEKKRRKQQQVKPEEETQVSEMVEHVHSLGRSFSGGVPCAGAFL